MPSTWFPAEQDVQTAPSLSCRCVLRKCSRHSVPNPSEVFSLQRDPGVTQLDLKKRLFPGCGEHPGAAAPLSFHSCQTFWTRLHFSSYKSKKLTHLRELAVNTRFLSPIWMAHVTGTGTHLPQREGHSILHKRWLHMDRSCHWWSAGWPGQWL